MREPEHHSGIYSHVAEDPALQREAAERVAALFLTPALSKTGD